MPNEYSTSCVGQLYFLCQGLSSLSLLLLLRKMSVFNANSVDLDQTPRSVASDLVLH